MGNCKHNGCRIRRKMSGLLSPSHHSDPAALGNGPGLVAAASEFRLSNGVTLAEASEDRELVLVFLRHFGCTFTRQILKGLEDTHQRARSRNAELVLVHMLKTGDEIRYLAKHSDIARIADPQCRLYRAFGLGKGSLIELASPRVLWLALVSIFKGCGVGHLAGDGRQMPGAFLFHRGKIIASQRAKSASDLPNLPALFHAAHSITRP